MMADIQHTQTRLKFTCLDVFAVPEIRIQGVNHA